MADHQMFTIVLGIAQDAGYPQVGCTKKCCGKSNIQKKLVSCIALVINHQDYRDAYLFDCTPDFREQYAILQKLDSTPLNLKGIFLTHGHIGHYTGMMFLGREAMSKKNLPVYCMPRMANFLKNHGPWSQLVALNNISIHEMKEKEDIQLEEGIVISNFEVPHRGEFTETVGFVIKNLSSKKSVLFLPDVDGWNDNPKMKWTVDIKQLLAPTTRAYIDGCFFDAEELQAITGRPDVQDIPHPTIQNSLDYFKDDSFKEQIYFIHLNHSNAALDNSTEEYQKVIKSGFHVATELETVSLT